MNSQGYQIVIAAVIGGGISLLTTWLNNKFQLRREEQQWLRQQEAERQKWYREQLYEIYKECISCLTKVSNCYDFASFEDFEWCVEAEKYLNLLLVNHQDKYSEPFYRLMEQITEFTSCPEIPRELATSLKNTVCSMMADDERIMGEE